MASRLAFLSGGFLLCALSAACDAGQEGRGGTSDPDASEQEPSSKESADGLCSDSSATATRVQLCESLYPGLFAPTARPTSSDDLLYYVNRWFSVDPCFPHDPGAPELASLRNHIDPAGGLEPEMANACGSYETSFVDVPAAWVDTQQTLRADAWYDGFGPMLEAASAEGHRLVVLSGYRSATTQRHTFENWVAAEGGDVEAVRVYSAEPLHSEHQLGTTADITYRDGAGNRVNPFYAPAQWNQSAAARWLRAHAHRYGIVTTYEPHRVGQHQYKPEPWHLRYVGPEVAQMLYHCDLSSEEYFGTRYRGGEALPVFSGLDRVYAAMAYDGWSDDACFDTPPAAVTAFCADAGVGRWCDHGALVSCRDDGIEVARTACSTSCCDAPGDLPDACTESLSESVARRYGCGAVDDDGCHGTHDWTCQ